MRRKWSEANADMAKRKLWPVPVDLVVTAMRIETAIRNIETKEIYVRAERPEELRIGQLYLVYGYHEIGSIFPDVVTASGLVSLDTRAPHMLPMPYAGCSELQRPPRKDRP
jgi:hypothetical protein